jgi:hypothetical protein
MPGMSTGEEAPSETFDWFVEPDHYTAPTSAYLRARLDERRTNSVGIVIITSLFFVLFAAAILVGGHAAIGPLFRYAVAAREAKGIGDVVYSMPDGVFCRHMSLNNATGEVMEGEIERCPSPIGARTLSASKFEWGTH